MTSKLFQHTNPMEPTVPFPSPLSSEISMQNYAIPRKKKGIYVVNQQTRLPTHLRQQKQSSSKRILWYQGNKAHSNFSFAHEAGVKQFLLTQTLRYRPTSTRPPHPANRSQPTDATAQNHVAAALHIASVAKQQARANVT